MIGAWCDACHLNPLPLQLASYMRIVVGLLYKYLLLYFGGVSSEPKYKKIFKLQL